MIRASLGDRTYWDESVGFLVNDVADRAKILSSPQGDASYLPQYSFNLSRELRHLLFTRYSRGDPITELSGYFPPLLDAWEQSEALGQSVWTEQQQYTRHAWAVNLDHYIVCFWLVGLALSLNIPDDQWKRLIALVGNDGEDKLLDHVIASRSPARKIGTKLCHPKPYRRLLAAVNAPTEQQAQLLQDFVRHWYQDLNRPPKPGLSEMTAMYDRPYWYTYGNKGSHDSGDFGRWCVEAVAAVKAFSLDDSLCLGYEHYPGDLLRPAGPNTHPVREDDVFETTPAVIAQPEADAQRKGWFSRWMHWS